MRREGGALSLMIALASCASPAAPAPGCPAGTRPDDPRAAAVVARLDSVPVGHALLASRDRILAICWGDPSSASVITTDRVALIASGLDDGEAAARLGHLLVHVRDGLPVEAIPAHAPDCDAAVDHALVLEARAYVVEVALQDALAAHPSMLAFEFTPELRAAADEPAREAIVLSYLRAHPDGAPGIDGLASAYRAHCAP